MTADRTSRVRLVLGLLLGSVVLSGCDFDVYALPLPGGTDVGDDPITVTVQFEDVLDLVPKSTVKVNDVSVGQVEVDRARRLPRQRHPRAAQRHQAPRQRDRRDPADQPARREVRLAVRRPRAAPSGEPLGDGDVIPLERHRPQPRGRGGARRAEPDPQRRRRGPAQDHRPGAQQGGHGPRGQRPLGAHPDRHLHRQPRHNKAQIVDAIEALNRLALSARQQEGNIDAALEELPSALTSIDGQRAGPGQDAPGARPARRRRRPGDQGVQGRRRSTRSASSSRCSTSSPTPATTSSRRSTSS